MCVCVCLWLIVTDFNLNPPLKLVIYSPSNNLLYKIYCKHVVYIAFFFLRIIKKNVKILNIVYIAFFFFF